MELHKNIQYYRKEAGLSQEQLAEKLNISRQAVSKWESGATSPDIDRLQDICSILNITLPMLLGIEQTENQSSLTVEQLAEIGKIVSDITSVNSKALTKKYILVSIGIIALFALTLGIFAYYITDRMDRDYSRLESMSNAGGVVYVPSTANTENSLVADYDYSVIDSSNSRQELTLRLLATPKVLRDGMTAEFVFVGNTETFSTPAVLENGTFKGEITLPVSDSLSFQLRITENGETTTAPLEVFYDFSQYMLTVITYDKALFSQKGSTVTLSGSIDVNINLPYNRYSGEIVPSALNLMGIVNVRLNGSNIYSYSINDVAPIDSEGVETEAAEDYSSITSYVSLSNTIENVKQGDKIEVVARITTSKGEEIERKAAEYTVN